MRHGWHQIGIVAPMIGRLDLCTRGAGLAVLAGVPRSRAIGAGLSALLCFSSITPVSAEMSDPPGERPNILLILIDTVRADHLGCYGHSRATSPTLDALAARGTLFENAMSQASWTKPSIPSLFTSRYPIQHRVFTGSTRDREDRVTSDVLREEELTIAEVLQASGYETAAFVENAQIRSFLGFDQGFARYEEDLGDAMAIASRFADWHESRGDAPYFAYLHMIDPHWPYTAPAEYAFPPPADPSIDFSTVGWKTLQRDVEERRIVPTDGDLEALRCLYDAEIRYADAAIGKVLDALANRGELEQTIVLVTSDHGEEFFEHGYLGHGNHLHQELLHVPFLLAGPGVPALRVKSRVQLIDVMPTLIELAGVDANATSVAPGATLGSASMAARVSGTSLVPVLRGEELARRKAFADHRPLGSRGPIQQCIAYESHKLIRSFAALEKTASSEPIPKLETKMWIEVEGEPVASGEFTAFDVEKIETEKEMSFRGPIGALSPSGSFEVLGLRCRLLDDGKIKNDSDQRLDFSALADGIWVSVRGRGWKDEVFQVFRIKLLEDSTGHDKQIKGPIESVGPGTPLPEYLALPGIKILLTDDTDFDGFDPADPREHSSENEESAKATRSPAEPAEMRTPMRREVYDLSNDPTETRDLIESETEMATALDRSLDQWVAELDRGDSSAAQVLDEETVERLRSLGYIK